MKTVAGTGHSAKYLEVGDVKKLVIGFCTALFVAASVPAYAAGLSVGPVAGVNWGDLSGVASASAQAGFTGGGFVETTFNENFGARLSAMYVRKGAKNNSNDAAAGPQSTTVKLDYVEFPLVFMAGSTPTHSTAFRGFAGPVLAFNTGGKGKTKSGDEVDIKKDVKSTEFSVVIGAEVEHLRGSNSVFFDFSYTIGATNAFELGDAKNRGLAVVAGMKFKLGS
ncbi:MAG TPA: porin family protein [Candidatus Krumholzibacteria bacterium]|nr:porin family protein [Candidatus Krumholzibacteria bacterium]